jgi:aminoglycoside 6'-N-acetyltransferase
VPLDLQLRPMTRADLPMLAGWLRQPHVEAWFPWEHGDTDPVAAVAVEYGPGIDGDDQTEYFVVEEAGHAVGFVQRYLFSAESEWTSILADALASPGPAIEPGIDPKTAIGIDYAIGDLTATGRGVGTAAISLFVADIFATYSDIDWIVVSMQQANRSSWRTLERVGFKRRWAGLLDSPDPSDAGPTFVYVRHRDW